MMNRLARSKLLVRSAFHAYHVVVAVQAKNAMARQPPQQEAVSPEVVQRADIASEKRCPLRVGERKLCEGVPRSHQDTLAELPILVNQVADVMDGVDAHKALRAMKNAELNN